MDDERVEIVREPGRRRRFWPWVVLPAGLLLALCLSLTAPMTSSPRKGDSLTSRSMSIHAAGTNPTDGGSTAPSANSVVSLSTIRSWPTTRLEGKPAKIFLLGALRQAEDRLIESRGYTATFRRRERIKGQLGEMQTIHLKSRVEPFEIYLKFISPTPGKEVLYSEGRMDGKVVTNGGGWTRRLVPRLAVDPKSPLALTDNRHPITEAGLLNLTRRLIRYRELDLSDDAAVTIIDPPDASAGRSTPRSLHLHSIQNPSRPFQMVEVLYDTSTLIPIQITSHDWQATGETGEPKIAEQYIYDNLNLDVRLTDEDFDLANKTYGFHRF